jgi:YVTN family beta-propeller protein
MRILKQIQGQMMLKRSLGLLFFSLMLIYPIESISGTFAYIANSGNGFPGNVSVIDVGSNLVVATIPIGDPNNNSPNGVSVSPDGARVYVTDGNGNSVSVISTYNNQVIKNISVGSYPTGIAVSPDGSKVYVANANDGTVSVIDSVTFSVIGLTIGVGSGPQGVSVSPDGARVYVTTEHDNKVNVIDSITNHLIGYVTVGASPYGVAVSPNGNMVYVTNNGDNPGSVSVINFSVTPASVTPVTVGGRPEGVAVSPDGSRVYVINDADSTISVINALAAPAPIVTNTININYNNDAAFPVGISLTPDGSKIYVANSATDNVSVVNSLTNSIMGSPITVGHSPQAFGNFIAVVPSSIPDLSERTKISLAIMAFGLVFWYQRRESV